MVTGIEAAGLVLAILPLVIEAAKSYSKGVNTIRNVTSNSRRDEKLQDFYEDFWWEAYLLRRHLRQIVDGLPILCLDCKEALKSDTTLATWEEDEVVKRALSSYFGAQEELDTFLLIMSKVLGLMDRLTKAKTTHLSAADKDPKSMYLRVKKLTAYRKVGVTSSSFQERFRFFKEEKNRDACINNLRTWNQRLGTVSHTDVTNRIEAQAVTKPPPSFREIRSLFDMFIQTVGKHWDCGCSSRHEAMLCLRVWPPEIRQSRPQELEFEILLSGKLSQDPYFQWLESTILVQSRRNLSMNDRLPLKKFCDILTDQGDGSFRFLVDMENTQERLWQLRSQPQKFSFLNRAAPKSLQQSLTARELTRLKDKRVLGLTFAYALIQYYGSPCLKGMLQKESVFFYNLTENHPDFGRPFVYTQFPGHEKGPDRPDMSLQHRSPAILTLGILMLEIHTGRLLESFLTPTEASNPSPNTRLMAARRIVEGLDDCSENYKDAIRACLEVHWVPAGGKVDLADNETGSGFYEHVIRQLEEELEYLFRLRI